MNANDFPILQFIFILLLQLLLYLLPGIIASFRGNRNNAPIWVINIFLGWTFVGWVVALAWSLTNDTTKHTAE